MEGGQKSKHSCKFCYKTFPCGRSLGGHMRTHLINISSTEKKLPPLTNAKHKHEHDGPIDLFVEDGYNPKKTRKISDNKACKECGKTFHSWKALFGHMKCHSVIEQGDSWSDHHKPISDNHLSSDSEAALCRRKRSHRPKRHTNTANSSTDQQEQEEVALSLILLSMDSVSSSVFESCSHESLDGKKTSKVSCSDDTKSSTSADVKFKFLNEEKRLKSNGKSFESEEVTSPKTLIKINPFGSSSDDKKNKFTCIICKKGFPSYQALGGHRASHKKFKGCCAPTTTSSHETDQINLTEENMECKKSKEHHCLICFKVFPSGQALGGHKRSHMITDQPNNTTERQRPIPEIHGAFLDLNLPAPLEDDCSEVKPWWIGNTHKHQHEPLLGLLSS